MSPWAKVAAMFVIAGASFGAGWNWNGARLGEQAAQAEADRTEAWRLAGNREREIERQWGAKLNEVATHAETEKSALAADLAASRLAADRLRTAASGAARRACAPPAAVTASAPQPDPDPLGVLVDVLAGLEERGRAVSEFADRLAIAGRACERSYDALTR